MTEQIGLAPEQLNVRRGFIGGTDAARILGVSKFGGPLQVYEDKMGLSVRRSSPAMHWGSILEGPVADEYARVTGRRLRRRKRPVIHPRYSFIGGYIDREIVGEPGLYEGKTGSSFSRSDWGDGLDEVPDDYYVQVQHYMACTGDEWADIATLLGGSDFRIYRVPRNDDFIVGLIDAEVTFWRDHIVTAAPPPVDGTTATAASLARRFPSADDSLLPATPADEALITDLIEAKRNAKAAADAERLAENRIKERIGSASGIVGAAGAATWKPVAGRPQWKAIAHEWKNLLGLYIPSEHWEHVTREGNEIVTRFTTDATRMLRVRGTREDA